MHYLFDFSDAVCALRTGMSLTTLVETGTYRGDSTLWAADIFDRVITIDISDGFLATARDRCKAHTNIEFVLGDSRTALPTVLASLNEPALYWLDAHNDKHLFGVGPNDCPLLEELQAIFGRKLNEAILIDDFHLFARPKLGFPSFDAIKTFARSAGYECYVTQDAIFLLPLGYIELTKVDHTCRAIGLPITLPNLSCCSAVMASTRRTGQP